MAPVGEIYFEPSWKKSATCGGIFLLWWIFEWMYATKTFCVKVDMMMPIDCYYNIILRYEMKWKKKWRKNNNEKTHTGKNTHLKNTTITHTHTHDTIYEYIQLWLWKYDELLNNLKNNPPDVVFWVFVTFNWKREFSMESTKRQCCKACLRIASVPKFEDF